MSLSTIQQFYSKHLIYNTVIINKISQKSARNINTLINSIDKNRKPQIPKRYSNHNRTNCNKNQEIFFLFSFSFARSVEEKSTKLKTLGRLCVVGWTPFYDRGGEFLSSFKAGTLVEYISFSLSYVSELEAYVCSNFLFIAHSRGEIICRSSYPHFSFRDDHDNLIQARERIGFHQ